MGIYRKICDNDWITLQQKWFEQGIILKSLWYYYGNCCVCKGSLRYRKDKRILYKQGQIVWN